MQWELCNLIWLFLYAHANGNEDILDRDDKTFEILRDRRELSFATSEYRDHRQGRIPNRIFSGPPLVKVTRSEILGQIGSNNVTLECFIDSYPKSVNFWTKGDLERLKPQENLEKYKITEENLPYYEFRDRFRLQFLNLEEDDIGNKFRCVSSNEYGTDSGLINIRSPIYLESKPHPQAFVEISQRARVVLHCEVKGYPLPVTYWFRNITGEQLSWDDEYHVTEHKISPFHYVSSLHIRKVKEKDFTVFKCVSRNTFGEKFHTFRVFEKNTWNPIKNLSSTLNSESRENFMLGIVAIFMFMKAALI